MLVAAELYEVCIGAQGQLDQQLGLRGIFNLSIKLTARNEVGSR